MGRRPSLHPDRAATKAERNALARERLKAQGGKTVTVDLPGSAVANLAAIKAEHACGDREAIILALARVAREILDSSEI